MLSACYRWDSIIGLATGPLIRFALHQGRNDLTETLLIVDCKFTEDEPTVEAAAQWPLALLRQKTSESLRPVAFNFIQQRDCVDHSINYRKLIAERVTRGVLLSDRRFRRILRALTSLSLL